MTNSKRLAATFLMGTILGGWASPALAQDALAPAPETPAQTPAPAQTAPVAPAVTGGTIRSLAVRGAERL